MTLPPENLLFARHGSKCFKWIMSRNSQNAKGLLLSPFYRNRKLNNFPKTHTNSWWNRHLSPALDSGVSGCYKRRETGLGGYLFLYFSGGGFCKDNCRQEDVSALLLRLLARPPFLPPDPLPASVPCSQAEAPCLSLLWQAQLGFHGLFPVSYSAVCLIPSMLFLV